MIDTHRNLLEHQDAVAPDPHDPLHEILEDLGEIPDMEELIGELETWKGHLNYPKTISSDM